MINVEHLQTCMVNNIYLEKTANFEEAGSEAAIKRS